MRNLRSVRHTPLIATMLGVGILIVARFLHPEYQFYYNASDSAPRGWYLRLPVRDLSLNTWVFAKLPPGAAALAAHRGYLPLSVPILKRIAAGPGQLVCTYHGELYVDDEFAARALTIDGAGRPLVAWQGCRKLHDRELLLLNPSSDVSFDARYFGPISSYAVIGNAVPLWTR